MPPAGPPPAPSAYLRDLPDEERHGLPTNFTQAQAGDPPLPPLADGPAPLTADAWRRERRPAILRLLADHQFGRTPPLDGIESRADVWEAGAPALGGLARRSQAELEFRKGEVSERIDVALWLPAATGKPAPVLLYLAFSPVALLVDDPAVREIEVWTMGEDGPRRIPGRAARKVGSLDLAAYIARGYGVAAVHYGDIEPDFSGAAGLGVRRLFDAPAETARAPGEWGAIGAWAWGASRVLDWLQAVAGVDGDRVALMGFSRLGKTALWAAAQDERFAAVIDCCSGLGGQSLARRNYGETIRHIVSPTAFAYWFAPRYADYAEKPEALPVDAHLLLAALAPRPVLLINGEADAWADPFGAFLAARAASPAWRLFGGEGVPGDAGPPELDASVGEDLRYFIHTGGHGSAPGDAEAIFAFLDAKLR